MRPLGNYLPIYRIEIGLRLWTLTEDWAETSHCQARETGLKLAVSLWVAGDTKSHHRQQGLSKFSMISIRKFTERESPA